MSRGPFPESPNELLAMFCAYALTVGIGYVVWPSFLALLRNIGALA
jgi:hypothetical protein